MLVLILKRSLGTSYGCGYIDMLSYMVFYLSPCIQAWFVILDRQWNLYCVSILFLSLLLFFIVFKLWKFFRLPPPLLQDRFSGLCLRSCLLVLLVLYIFPVYGAVPACSNNNMGCHFFLACALFFRCLLVQFPLICFLPRFCTRLGGIVCCYTWTFLVGNYSGYFTAFDR